MPRGRGRTDSGDKQTPVEAAQAVFGAMSDSDFFSDKVQHLYFFGQVDDDSVANLQADLRNANRATTSEGDIVAAPKPIVIHVFSPGGSLIAAMSMLTVFTRSHVPICVMVDGFSASAATALSIIAPYRVGASAQVLTLIHQYSAGLYGTKEQLEFQVSVANKSAQTFNDLYLSNTRLTTEQLDELISRDIWLDTTYCLKHGIMDRVLDIDNTEHITGYRRRRSDFDNLPLHVLMAKTNWNSFSIACVNSMSDDRETATLLDRYLCSTDNVKPVLYYCTMRCEMNYMQWIPIVARIRAFRVPVYAVTDAVIDIWNFLPSLYCTRRYMYVHATVVIDVVYFAQWGRRLPDIVFNTNIVLDTLRAVLRERTRVPAALLLALASRRLQFSAQECLAYGMCDELVQLGGHRR